MSAEQVRAFTGLRGVSCLFVILCHCAHMGFIKDWKAILECGTTCVHFFFVLSAYLLTKRGLQEIQPDPSQIPNSFWGMRLVYYCIRRFFRIYPAYMASLLLVLVLCAYADRVGFQHSIIRDYDQPFIKSLYGRGAKYHFQTIPVEMIFYLIMLPIILVPLAEIMRLDHKFFKGSRRFNLTFLFQLMLTGGVIIFLHYIDNLDIHTFNFYIPTFGCGCVGGFISHYLKIRQFEFKVTNKIQRMGVETLTYAIVVRIMLSHDSLAQAYLNRDPDANPSSYALASPFHALLLLWIELTQHHNSLAKAMSTQFFHWSGEVSYSVYLIHMCPIIMLLIHRRLEGADATVAAVFLAYLIGYFWYLLFETNGVKLGNVIIRKIRDSLKPRVVGDQGKIEVQVQDDNIELIPPIASTSM